MGPAARGLPARAELGGQGEQGKGRMCGFRVVSEDHGSDRDEMALCGEDDDDTHELDALLRQSGVFRAQPR